MGAVVRTEVCPEALVTSRIVLGRSPPVFCLFGAASSCSIRRRLCPSEGESRSSSGRSTHPGLGSLGRGALKEVGLGYSWGVRV